MRPRGYSSEAVILARRDYSEADRILVVYTKESGKRYLMAKGVRKPSSRKRGSLEVFSYIKFAAMRGKDLDLMTEVETIENYSGIRRNLKKVTLAYYFMETVGRTSHENEPNAEIYNLILNFMERLEKEKSLKSLRLEFIQKLLELGGFWPKGKLLEDHDRKIEEVMEKIPSSVRVGKRMLEHFS